MDPYTLFLQEFHLDELIALYHVSNVALVTPLRDGMNLVAKEFVAAKAGKAACLS
jgi:trehalose 6-phosphate synthase/phosphatase